jgi:hypothetical protein
LAAIGNAAIPPISISFQRLITDPVKRRQDRTVIEIGKEINDVTPNTAADHRHLNPTWTEGSVEIEPRKDAPY